MSNKINILNEYDNGLDLVKVTKREKRRILEAALQKAGLVDEGVINKTLVKKRWDFRKIAIAAVMCCAITATVLAANDIMSIFRKVFRDSADILQNYIKVINVSAKDNGVTFTVESALKDVNGTFIFYEISKDEGDFPGSSIEASLKSVKFNDAERGGVFSGLGGTMEPGVKNRLSGVLYFPDNLMQKPTTADILIKDLYAIDIDDVERFTYLWDLDIGSLINRYDIEGQQIIEVPHGKDIQGNDIMVPCLMKRGLNLKPFEDAYFAIDNIALRDGRLHVRIDQGEFNEINQPINSPHVTLINGDKVIEPEPFIGQHTDGALHLTFDISGIGDLKECKFNFQYIPLENIIKGTWNVVFDLPTETPPLYEMDCRMHKTQNGDSWRIYKLQLTPVSLKVQMLVEIADPLYIYYDELQRPSVRPVLHAQVRLKNGEVIDSEVNKIRSAKGSVGYTYGFNPSENKLNHMSVDKTFIFNRAFNYEDIEDVVVYFSPEGKPFDVNDSLIVKASDYPFKNK